MLSPGLGRCQLWKSNLCYLHLVSLNMNSGVCCHSKDLLCSAPYAQSAFVPVCNEGCKRQGLLAKLHPPQILSSYVYQKNISACVFKTCQANLQALSSFPTIHCMSSSVNGFITLGCLFKIPKGPIRLLLLFVKVLVLV